MDPLALAALGALVGAATGLLPGLHVNTLCASALAFAPSDPGTAILLAAAAAAHLLTATLPATYLGVPGEDSGLGVLPAHRMTLAGRGPDAVRLAVRGTLAGLLAGIVLLLPHKWLLGEPLHLLDWVERHMAWLLFAVLLLLLAREAVRGTGALLRATFVLALAATLGFVSSRLVVHAFVDVPATPLLPLLGGLFGAPALLDGLRAGRPIPPQHSARPGLRLHRSATATAIAATSLTCLMPGLTSSVTLAATRWSEDRHGHAFLSAQAAIGGAHLVFSFGLLWLALTPRTGLAVAVQALWPGPAWMPGAAPPPVLPVLTAVTLGAAFGTIAACGGDRVAARLLPRIGRTACALALAFATTLVVVLSGWTGLALFATATAVGLLPPRLGVARLHLTACLLVPVLAYRLGLTP